MNKHSENKEDEILSHVVNRLARSLSTQSIDDLFTENQDELWLACLQITNTMQIPCEKPANVLHTKNTYKWLLAIADASHFRVRKVSLRGVWWQQDNGSLLVFDRDSKRPQALLWQKESYYQLYDPQTLSKKALTPELADKLILEAYCFYPCLPDSPISLGTFLRFAFRNRKVDITRLLLFQVTIGLISLVIPIATGILLNTVIPNAEMSLLTQWIIALIVCTVVTTLFAASQLLVIIRLRFKMNVYAQAAIWDRILRLPVHFFRQFSPGDLVNRAEGIDSIQQQLSEASLQAVLGGIFSLLTLGLMFYYSVLLATMVVCFVFVLCILLFIAATIQLKFQRPLASLRGYLTAFNLQFLNAISKLRTTHSELQLFSVWAASFAKKNQLMFKAALTVIYFIVINSFISIFGLLTLFGLIGSGIVSISFGSFIAFNAAFAQFFAATLALMSLVITYIRLIPLYERIKPVLTASAERESTGLSLVNLTGEISISSLNFKFQTDGPFILKDLSLEIKSGEMIALVGPTGSGKSTLLRLLLGFETPLTGNIEYDSHKLSSLNLQTLREQLGVVLQNSTLLPGTIFENIQGSQIISLEQAWEAAAQAELADMIHALPMGMQTLVAERGKTFSVGQRQQILIARALARKPKILMFDEATSALDNPTQEKIMLHLAKLKITRIFVAHRLSTLVSADCIYVLDTGRIVQQGNYDSLLAQPGLFHTLAKRQLIL